MADYPDQSPFVRRTDVLLRAHYPHLITRVFEIAPQNFSIVFEYELQPADDIAKFFDNSIRPVTVPVSLSNTLPRQFIREIEPIANENLTKGFEGYLFTAFDLTNYLASCCPELPVILGTGNENHPILTLRFPRNLSSEERVLVETKLAALMPGWPIDIATADPNLERPRISPPDGLTIIAARLRSAAPAFVTLDQQYFWSNIDSIFAGRHNVHEHPSMSDVGMCCYVDGSAFPNIDLRQLLLLYDTVLLSPPIADGTNRQFWNSQGLDKADLLRIVDAGRLRLLLRQPEERTDIRWLEEVYERSPTAIIGRLAGAALFACDLVNTANEYTLSQPQHRLTITLIARALTTELGVPEREVQDLLLWPIGARLLCPRPLLDRGLIAIPSFGLGQVLAHQIEREAGKDVTLEAMSAADGVHIAHALGATFIAPSDGLEGWHPAREAIGQRLNFYRSFNSRVSAAWAVNERRKESRKSVLPPLPIFTFPKHTSVDDILDISGRRSVRFSGRALISRLADLPVEERFSEIQRLEKQLHDRQMTRERRNLHLDTADATLDIANDVLSWGLWPVMSGLKITQRLIDVARKNPRFDVFADTLERDIGGQFGRNADLDFLDNVNRIAVLNTPTD